jgi:hypothetical protein
MKMKKMTANDVGQVSPVADWLTRAAARPFPIHLRRGSQTGESLTQCLSNLQILIICIATVNIVALTCTIVRQAVINDFSNSGAMTNISYRLNASTEAP